ncbi:hypothetical protein MesoLj113a_32780 [Mesorhizobium sp. 113-1-2]|uniref:PP_RS20740 family protein n=1 Tax=Mesorhizobium sp. 113-1-2 TaxID=2744515 RepID=UPI001928F630|nr:hypothetical protein [Mesorhizobium sp. 113-1-2]BCG72120.1 hypothetical protein MesoLj113a_32780 [Mesorhizobium sp. 113-1-2]
MIGEKMGSASGLENEAAIEPIAGGNGEEQYIDAVFGANPEHETVLGVSLELRKNFAPWHHPIKQIVRLYQWADQVKRLVEKHRPKEGLETLRYFTLPGSDLLDVRVLAETLSASGIRIDYFGFDMGYEGADSGDPAADSNGVYLATESALRQAGRIADGAEVLADRLEDIAIKGSQAANRLRQKGIFDVVNIDACDHLGYVPKNRANSIFDALEAMLAHQLPAVDPWLLFITTRASPDLLGAPATKLQGAIHKNLDQHSSAFGDPLATCLGGDPLNLAGELASHWSTQGFSFLKLFSIGLGKYLLQYYHAQQNLPAKVELVSAFTYKVSKDEPDMLSLAFRITPDGIKVQPGSAGGAAVIPPLELKDAVAVIDKAAKLWYLDDAVANDESLRMEAILSTEALLASAHYDIPFWRKWLAELPVRPMQLDTAA